MKSIPLPSTTFKPQPYTGPSADQVLALRKQYLNPGLFLYYKKPIMIVEGKMQWVWDDTGKRYLDGLGGIDTLININRIRGSAHADVIYGSDTVQGDERFEAAGGRGYDRRPRWYRLGHVSEQRRGRHGESHCDGQRLLQ